MNLAVPMETRVSRRVTVSTISLDFSGNVAQEELVEMVSPLFLQQARILPVSMEPNRLVVAVAAPLDEQAMEALSMAVERPVQCHVIDSAEFDNLLRQRSGDVRSVIQQIVDDLEPAADGSDDDIDHLKDIASEAPVVRLVNHLIEEAVRQRASDIHIEPYPDELAVRLRVDGVLRDQPTAPVRLAKAVASRIKILAGLNIAEHRLPQDGRVAQSVLGRRMDMRVSTVPTIHGESLVIRLLDNTVGALPLSDLGMRPEDETRFRHLMDVPNGIILVTGPTGSGKSTSLYAALNLIDATELKVLTIEDPVEYHMARVNQLQVRPQIGLTFSSILRSLLRQDPDVVMIGEMRDSETADIAVHAALTGHLVLSTLHTNSAAGAIVRLVDMGVEPFLLTSTIRAVIGQRLVRRLCFHCRAPHKISADEHEAVKSLLAIDAPEGGTAFSAVGCDYCTHTGYVGRIGLFEMLVLNDELRQLTQMRAGADRLEAAALKAGMRSMAEDGLLKVLDGLTTFEEVRRVADWT